VTIILQKPLFSWDELERSSGLYRLELGLQYLPDEPIVRALELQRGRGRNTYPVRPVWNAMLAGIVLQHPTVESLLRELSRNAELRLVCGATRSWERTRFPPRSPCRALWPTSSSTPT